MAEYIDGDKLCRVIAGHSYYSGDRILSRIRCLQEGKTINKSIKPDDVAPVVHAHWEDYKDDTMTSLYGYPYCGIMCSHCGIDPMREHNMDYMTVIELPYCCDCGAKMDENEKQTPKQGFLEN